MLLFVTLTKAQEYFPINTGVKTSKNTMVAFKNATIFMSSDLVIKKGTLLIKDGKVVSVGKSVKIPKGITTIDLSGKTIYPSFIDIYSDFGIKKPKRDFSRGRRPQYEAERKGYYWNDHIRPETSSYSLFKFDSKKSKEYLKAGFGVVNTHSQDGIMRGSGMLVSLNPNSNNAYRILDDNSGQYLSFSKSVKSRQSYPTSRMGAMALLRQTYLDANWYEKGKMKNSDLSLHALNKHKNETQIFETGSHIDAVRADKIGDEFGIQYTIVGSGDEFERIQDIKNTNAKFIIPINFRVAYDVADPLLAQHIDLGEMRKWNQEPSNLNVLTNNGISFALTTHKLKSISSFHKNLRKAIKYGFNKKNALAALTSIPAQILGNDKIGNLNIGSYANFIITSGDVFDSKTTIHENWVQGDRNIISDMNIKDITGDYLLRVNNEEYNLSISGKGAKQKGNLTIGNEKIKSTFSFENNWISITINNKGTYTRILGKISNSSDKMYGTAFDSSGNQTSWTTSKIIKEKIKDKKKNTVKENDIDLHPVSFPNIGYGNFTQPSQQTILIKNTTVWTSESEGILKNTDVLLKNGKIVLIGSNIKDNKALIIDGMGKHLTAGIVDEHSHIAASAINEGGHNSTAEVTIEDVVDPTDINIYRNLSGGTTSIQILHGSANPIGGRSAIIKLKWGENAENLIYKNSPKFIKFALGENVKQSRSNTSYRFPQTRMGVEQVFTDYFQRAKEYDLLKKSGQPYRKDLEMETLAEILNKERYI